MASTYTDNTGIEKPGPGEQAGTWGTTTNTNFDLIDRNLNGVGAITLTGSTHTLSTSDGTLSDGHYRALILGGTPGANCTITISPNDQDKVYLVFNNTTGGYSATFTQGSGGNATIANGATAWIYADGGGATAQVRAVPSDVVDDASPQLGGNLDVNGNSIVSVSDGDIAITPNGTGDVIIDGIKHPQADGNAGEFLKTDGSGQLSFADVAASAFNSGMLVTYAGATAPTGWLLCHGQGIDTTTYADLFAVVGYTYGGSGSTFNVPDLRGRVVAGKDDMGGTSADRLTNQSGGLNGDSLGAAGGSETHTLSEAQLPAHRHFVAASVSVGSASSSVASVNSTTQVARTYQSPYGGGGEIFSMQLSRTNDDADVGRSSSVGSGSAHNNIQPTFILNYIIKT